jgi:hypothetical protein
VSEIQIPQGVIAILTGPNGHVYAVGTDFSTCFSNRYSIKEAQEYRAKRMMVDLFVLNSCCGFVAKAMRDSDADAIVSTLCQRDGFLRTIKYIGYPEGEQ